MSKSKKMIKEQKERGSSGHSTAKALNNLAQQKPPTSVQPSASRRDSTRSRTTVNSGAPRLPAYDKKGSTNDGVQGIDSNRKRKAAARKSRSQDQERRPPQTPPPSIIAPPPIKEIIRSRSDVNSTAPTSPHLDEQECQYENSTNNDDNGSKDLPTSQQARKRQKMCHEEEQKRSNGVDIQTITAIKELILQGNSQLQSFMEGPIGSNKEGNEITEKLTRIEKVLQHHTDILYSLVYLSYSKNKKKNVTHKDKKIEIELALLEDIFNESALERVFERCTMGFVAQVLNCCLKRDICRQSSLALRTILYAKSVQDKLAVYDSGIARDLSLFRESIVRTFVTSVRQNVFNQFEGEKGNGYGEGKHIIERIIDDESAEMKKPIRPKWLCDGYITDEHYEFAKNKRETIQNEDSVKPESSNRERSWNLTRCEIAREACDRIYRIVINGMKAGRETAKNSFFQEVGYIFTIWDQLMAPMLKKKNLSQESIDLQWYCEDQGELMIDLDEIETTAAVPRTNLDFSSADDDPSKDQKRNKEKFASFLVNHPEMCLAVSHDVVVKYTEKKKVSYEKKKLSHSINLLDVAARFLSNFVGLKNPVSPLSILSSCPDSMKVIYGLALLFKGLINKIMDELSKDNSVLYRSEGNDEEDYGEYNAVHFEGICLDDLFPSRTRQLKSMNKVLLLTSGEYYSLHEGKKTLLASNNENYNSLSSKDDSDDDQVEVNKDKRREVPIYKLD